MYSPDFLSLYELLVASESVVRVVCLVVVRASASLPVKPMSEILFWYIRLNPPFLSPDLLGALSRDGREGWLLPSAQARFLGGRPRSGRNQDPKGGEAEAEHRRAAGRSLMFPSRCLRTDGKETRKRVTERYRSAETQDCGHNHLSQ